MKRAWPVGLVGVVLLAGCSDALEQSTSAGQVVLAVNAGDGTLSLVSVTDRSVTSLMVPPTGAAPTSLAALGDVVAVPGGDSAALAVFDFSNGSPPAVRHLPLSANAAPSGVAIEDDSIAWVANPNLNTVTRINLRRGDTASFAVGTYPQAVAAVGGYIYVVNGNLSSGVPAGPSWITVLEGTGTATPPARDSIPLTGSNARSVTLGADGLLYVVDAGTPGSGDGKLSIVDPVGLTEDAVLNNLGESPGLAVYHPSGRLLIASATEGILEVNTSTRTIVRGPAAPAPAVRPGGHGVTALALDQKGRVYAFDQGDCSGPGVLRILSAPPDYDVLQQLTVGVCPSAAATIVVP